MENLSKNSIATLVSFLLLLYIPVCLEAFEIAIDNPGFEEIGGNGRPVGYNTYVGANKQVIVMPGNVVIGNPIFAVDSEISHSGSKSISIQCGDIEASNCHSNVISNPPLWRTTIPILKGVTYKIECWAKTLQVNGKVHLVIRFLTANNVYTDGYVEGTYLNGTMPWTKISATFTPTKNSVKAQIMFVGRMTRGKVWFDDLKVYDNREILQQIMLDAENIFREGKNTFAHQSQNGYQKKIREIDEYLTQLCFLKSEIEDYITGKSKSIEFIEELNDIQKHVDIVEYETSFLKAKLEMQTKFNISEPAYAVGWLSSMERAFLKDSPYNGEINKQYDLNVFRGETESVQIVITPFIEELKKVEIKVSDFSNANGKLPKPLVSVHPVGFVYVEENTVYSPYIHEKDYIGWWPDPLLENFPFDVEEGTIQPVWFQIQIPRGMAPGSYKGIITISPENAHKIKLVLQLNIWPVEVPERTKLKTLISYNDGFGKAVYASDWWKKKIG